MCLYLFFLPYNMLMWESISTILASASRRRATNHPSHLLDKNHHSMSDGTHMGRISHPLAMNIYSPRQWYVELEAAKLASRTFMSARAAANFLRLMPDPGSATGEIHPAAAQIHIYICIYTRERAWERPFVLCVFFTWSSFMSFHGDSWTRELESSAVAFCSSWERKTGKISTGTVLLSCLGRLIVLVCRIGAQYLLKLTRLWKWLGERERTFL